MTNEDREELERRYEEAAHAVQSGVAMEMNYRPEPTQPKHLRTGIDLTKAEVGGLVRMLIAKGVFSEEEYMEAIALGVEEEQASYEKRLSDLLMSKVTLA